MRSRTLIGICSLLLMMAAAGCMTLATHRQNSKAIADRLPTLAAAVKGYSQDRVARGQTLPGSVSAQELVDGGYLTPEQVRELDGLDAKFWPATRSDDPQAVLVYAQMPRGNLIVALGDGSIKEVPDSKRQIRSKASVRRSLNSAQPAPIFMHLLAPRYYTDPPIPARRIVTTQITLGKDFAVSVGDDGLGNAILAGRVDRHGNGFFAHLMGVSYTTANYMDGQVEPERPFSATSGVFSGGIWSAYFVLSTNADCSSFLRRLDQGFE